VFAHLGQILGDRAGTTPMVSVSMPA